MTTTAEDPRLIFGRDNIGRIYVRSTSGLWSGVVLAKPTGKLELGYINGLSAFSATLYRNATPDSVIKLRVASDGALYVRGRAGDETPLLYQVYNDLYCDGVKLGTVAYPRDVPVFGSDIVDIPELQLCADELGGLYIAAPGGGLYAVATRLVDGVYSFGRRLVGIAEIASLFYVEDVVGLNGLTFNFNIDRYVSGSVNRYYEPGTSELETAGLTFNFIGSQFVLGQKLYEQVS